jgi:hypothetical protein
MLGYWFILPCSRVNYEIMIAFKRKQLLGLKVVITAGLTSSIEQVVKPACADGCCSYVGRVCRRLS